MDGTVDMSGRPRVTAVCEAASPPSPWAPEAGAASSADRRRIRIVPMARKLLAALRRYVTQGIVPEDAVTTA